ncbi:hypothetical protein AB9F29_16795 [Falsihalocynthiibacter sp. S25ZX9]|uniref:hypothetical protein n=1 Tax=Falsihalocynthiibacter sp. S25ZX9 TaxID=3240870 RepID=UPI0035102FFD
MHRLRIKAIIRKYKISGVVVFSIIGLASAFAVNVGGFLVLLPKPLWALVDSSFVSSYFIRFSILLALAFFTARYSSYIISQSIGVLWGGGIVFSLLASRSGQRLLRRRGNNVVKNGDDALSKFFENDNLDHDDKTIAAYNAARRFYILEVARPLLGMVYIFGFIRGGFDYKVERYSIPIQLVAIFLVLSALFTTLTGSALLVGVGLLLALLLPPSFGDAYFRKTNFAPKLSLLNFLKLEGWQIFSFQKITLLVLTLSFLSGTLHHRSLLSETRNLRFVGEVNIIGSLVFSSNSGFVIHSDLNGYQVIPTEGTQIEMISSNYKANH